MRDNCQWREPGIRKVPQSVGLIWAFALVFPRCHVYAHLHTVNYLVYLRRTAENLPETGTRVHTPTAQCSCLERAHRMEDDTLSAFGIIPAAQ